MTKKAEREEAIRAKAMELARSGEFDEWLSIEIELGLNGYDEARSALDVSWFRERLDAECAAAQKKT
ncbi:MAG: hypothetical protein WDN46_12720 [Methylocella sp.]